MTPTERVLREAIVSAVERLTHRCPCCDDDDLGAPCECLDGSWQDIAKNLRAALAEADRLAAQTTERWGLWSFFGEFWSSPLAGEQRESDPDYPGEERAVFQSREAAANANRTPRPHSTLDYEPRPLPDKAPDLRPAMRDALTEEEQTEEARRRG
jgi:hypothetical protein